MGIDTHSEEIIQHWKWDLHKGTGEIAFSWNRKYEHENDIHNKLESEYQVKDMSETGVYIDETAMVSSFTD